MLVFSIVKVILPITYIHIYIQHIGVVGDDDNNDNIIIC